VPRGGFYLLGFKTSGSLPLFFLLLPLVLPSASVWARRVLGGQTERERERERVGITGDSNMAVLFYVHI